MVTVPEKTAAMPLNPYREGVVTKRTKTISAVLESYLEKIQVLQKKYGAVRVTDLAEQMNCRMPSAVSALRRLAEFGLVNYESYRPVTLTAAGEEAVRKLTCRHEILDDFLQTALAFSPAEASEEACSLEHKVSREVLQRCSDFLQFVRSEPGLEEKVGLIVQQFRRFLETRKR